MKYNKIFNIKYILFVIVIVLVVYAIYIYATHSIKKDNFEGCESNTAIKQDIPDRAAQACKTISSKADIIKASFDGAADLAASFQSFMNPRNYKAGDNTTTNTMRNIINVNLSKCEIEKIHNACENSIATYQKNELSTKDCEWCDTHGCTLKGNIQKNTVKANNICNIRFASKALSEKTSSVDAQALAKVLQETDGLLSGSNTAKVENCNLIDHDLSSQNYLETKNNCLNDIASTQINTIQACGSILENIQENDALAVQECMLGTKLDKTDIVGAETKTKQETLVDQVSKGVTMEGMLSSSVSSFISSSLFLVIGFYFMNMEMEIE